MDRLISLEPSNKVSIRIEPGHRCSGHVTLRNVMYTMPVAFRIQPMTPNRYTISPQSGIIAPLATITVEVTYHLSLSSALPNESIPHSSDSFLIDSVVVPGAAFKNKNSTSEVVPADWFTTKKKQVFTDSGMKVFFLGSVVLTQLVGQGKMDHVREVLERSDPKWNAANSVDSLGQSLLHIAISLSRPDLVQLLLEFNPNIEATNRSGHTPLEAAAAIGESLIVELLLAHDASTEKSPASKFGPVHLASSHGHFDVLRLLVLKRADVDALTSDGRTALHLAVEGRHRGCTKLLLAVGARAETRGGPDGDTALHVAAANGDESMVKLLISKGCAGLKDVRNFAGKTAYDIAAEEGQGRLFDLLKLGDGLAIAARRGEGRAVVRLIERGAILNGRDQNGWTALMRAAFKGWVEVMKSLIERGAELDARDEEGYTALHCAVEAGQVEAVEVIVKRGADFEARTRKGATAMKIARSLGYVGIERILMQAGAAKEAVVVGGGVQAGVAVAVEKQRIMMEGKKKKESSRGRSRLNRVAMPMPVASY